MLLGHAHCQCNESSYPLCRCNHGDGTITNTSHICEMIKGKKYLKLWQLFKNYVNNVEQVEGFNKTLY